MRIIRYKLVNSSTSKLNIASFFLYLFMLKIYILCVVSKYNEKVPCLFAYRIVSILRKNNRNKLRKGTHNTKQL